jgi:hypothetical protein
MSDHLITSRRNFLIRASAITAAGTAVAVPIITVEDARARANHHLEGLHKAICDLYPGNSFKVSANFPEGEHADPRVMSDRVIAMITSKKFPVPAPEYRKVFKRWQDYDYCRAGGRPDDSMFKIVNMNEE